MRCRRAIRTVFVYVLLGAVATVASSWAIHGVSFRLARKSPHLYTHGTATVFWPYHESIRRGLAIPADPVPADIHAEIQRGDTISLFVNGPLFDDALPVDTATDADAAWRRHRRMAPGLSPTPDYAFPYLLNKELVSHAAWSVLRSRTRIINPDTEQANARTHEHMFLFRVGWPARAMETGAHYTVRTEAPTRSTGQPTTHGRTGDDTELTSPRLLSWTGGLELWPATRPPAPTPLSVSWYREPLDRFALPLLPLWPGFLLNTIFYALLLFALVRGVRLLRRARRRRRGRCVGCGYDREGLDRGVACPECGAGVA